jgi:hypothetical protein
MPCHETRGGTRDFLTREREYVFFPKNTVRPSLPIFVIFVSRRCQTQSMLHTPVEHFIIIPPTLQYHTLLHLTPLSIKAITLYRLQRRIAECTRTGAMLTSASTLAKLRGRDASLHKSRPKEAADATTMACTTTGHPIVTTQASRPTFPPR